MNAIPTEDREQIVRLAKHYCAYQGGGHKATIAHKGRIFDVDISNDYVAEREGRVSESPKFTALNPIDDETLELVVRLWNEDRINRGATSFFISTVHVNGESYLVDGGWQTVERMRG